MFIFFQGVSTWLRVKTPLSLVATLSLFFKKYIYQTGHPKEGPVWWVLKPSAFYGWVGNNRKNVEIPHFLQFLLGTQT